MVGFNRPEEAFRSFETLQRCSVFPFIAIPLFLVPWEMSGAFLIILMLLLVLAVNIPAVCTASDCVTRNKVHL